MTDAATAFQQTLADLTAARAQTRRAAADAAAHTFTVTTSRMDVVQDFQSDRQHRFAVIIAVDNGYLADYFTTYEQAEAVRDAARQRPDVRWSATVPPADQSPALPPAIRRERFLQAIADRKAARAQAQR